MTSNQSVDVGADTRITGFDNVYVTPGRDVFSNVNTSIVATSNANALVRGLIAVPDATATTNVVSNASLNLAAGTNTESAQNVIVGSYQGFLTAQADGTGRGYQLGFIPVTQHDSNKNVSSSAPVTIAGNITAGIYHDLELVINCGTGVTCGANTPVVAELKSGAPTLVAISNNFEPDDYINSLGLQDEEVLDSLLAGTSSTAVQAVLLGQLFAAGGTVTINAGQIIGAGQVTSYGGPTISVTNSSAAYLILGDGAYIPDTPGGQIIFTGAAGQSQAGSLALNEVIGTGPSITIENTYTGPAPGDKPGYGPALFLHGDVTNLGGGVALTNATGSFGQFGNVSSRQLNITVPLGVTTISANGPGGLWSAGGSPIAEWKDYMYFPGGNPSAVASNVNQTVQFLANILYPASDSNDLNYNQLYQRSYDWIRPGTTHESQVFFGNCGIAANWNENCYYGTQVQFTGQAYSFVDEEDDNEFQPWLAYYNTATRTAALSAANISGSQASAAVLGNQVVIKASVININGRIEAGWQTNWSVHLDDTLTVQGDAIDYFENLYANTGQVLHDLKPYSNGIAAGDKQIGAKYDAAANQIVLDDVHASSGGTSVILEGKIISSNLLGHIHINGGLGHVTVENETGIALVVNKVNTGSEDGASSTSSKVKIYDKLITSGPNTTTYVFNPGAGIDVYATNNGVNPVLDGATPDAPSFHIDGTETSYSPTDDIRFEWNRRATFNRYWSDINNIPGWTYSSGSSNDPWWYVSQNGVYYNPSSPQGYTVQGDATQADFIQQFSGSGNYVDAYFEYHNCITIFDINSCNWGFPLTGYDGDRYFGAWNYHFYYSGNVTLKQSVRADNPFKIDFTGNASGLVDISSNSNVTFAGSIINPTGDLNVVATAGAGKTAAVAMTSEGSILTKNMSLEGTSIGASTAAIRATLADDGILHANASQGAINIDLNSGATLSSISAGTAQARSDVTITATGDLVHGSGAGTDVTGNNITLSSGNGSVGTSATAVTMEARGTTLSGGDVVGGVINISAQDDINISHNGTVRAGQITSTGGDVTIRAIGGGIVDALGQTQSTNVSQESIDALSERLHLTSDDGAEQHAIDVSVKPFETLVDTSYDRYQQMLGQGSVSASAYTLDQAGFDRYRPLAKLALGLDTNSDRRPGPGLRRQLRRLFAQCRLDRALSAL